MTFSSHSQLEYLLPIHSNLHICILLQFWYYTWNFIELQLQEFFGHKKKDLGFVGVFFPPLRFP